jgi:excisionase family DNA binding protein
MEEKSQSNNNQLPVQPKEIMDVHELAHYIGIGKSKIYQLIREKKIPASRIGRQYRFSKAVIDAWMKENLITSTNVQLSLDKLLKR